MEISFVRHMHKSDMTEATDSDAMSSDGFVSTDPAASAQQAYMLEAVQQYEEECLLSSRNQEEARQMDLPV